MDTLVGEAKRRVLCNESAKDLPIKAGTTHVIISFPSKKQEDLWRADGMLVASRNSGGGSDVVRFGHDIGTVQSRLFLNEELAKKFLRRLASLDMAADHQGKSLSEISYSYTKAEFQTCIEERDGESLLTLPGSHRAGFQ